MGRSVNHAVILGNLGDAPKTITGGIAFRVATSEQWTDNDGHRQERTDWHRVVIFGKRAAALGKMLRKGSRVAVTASLRTSSYDDPKTGEKRHSVDLIASDVVLCDPAPKGAGGRPQDDADDMPEAG